MTTVEKEGFWVCKDLEEALLFCRLLADFESQAIGNWEWEWEWEWAWAWKWKWKWKWKCGWWMAGGIIRVPSSRNLKCGGARQAAVFARMDAGSP
jgi:hypothetical protein